MSDDTPEEAIERGMEAYFAGDTITDLLDGIDIDALADGAALDDAVEYEQLGNVLGALIGRAAAKGVSDSGLLGRIVKESVGKEMGGRVGEAAAAALVEHGSPEALAEQIRSVTDPERLDRFAEGVNGAVAGSNIEEFGSMDETDWTEIDVEDESEE